MSGNRHDVVVLGAGPAGCAAALTFSRQGRSVLLLEADPRRHDRLGSEWLHPTALASLEALGVDLAPPRPFPTGRGWAFHPDDGSDPVVVPYPSGSQGAAIQHDVLVETLREHASRASGVTYVPWSRATRIEGANVSYARRLASGRLEVETARGELVIGATGRSGAPFAEDEPLHVATPPCSRLLGLVLRDAGELPFEGFQHIATGGPGPVVLHRLSPSEIRVLLDVPLSLALPSDKSPERAVVLEEAYRSMIPGSLRPAFRAALRAGLEQTHNAVRPRQGFGAGGALSGGRLALVGDALGFQHPLTSLGLVLALRDVEDLAASKTLSEYAERRQSESRVPEMIAIALYEVLADQAPSTVAIRTAIFRMLREHPEERLRMMALVSGQNRSRLAFSRSFAAMLLRGGRDLALWGARTRRLDETSGLVTDIGARLGWLLGGTLRLTSALPSTHKGPRTAEEQYGAALRASRAGAEVVGLAASPSRAPAPRVAPATAIERAFRALGHEQDDDGSFEGEVVWCAMLPAQFVLAMHVLGVPLDETRRRRLIRQFEVTRDAQGTWGLHLLSEPYLFVTTLVYVAARLLGVTAEDPLLAPARRMFERENGILEVPSWGKLWLALVGLWDWEGVNPVLPEAWSLPTSAPIHPSRYYCHTRNIYLAMATLYGERFVGPITPRIEELRRELFPDGFDRVDFAAAREKLRDADLWEKPTAALKLVFRASKLFERVAVRGGAHAPGPRQRLLSELRDQIRYEMRSTHHTCISPVSGLLGMIALHAADPADPDVARALDSFEGWIWEDDEDGLRVAGARSASWDTAFALQALSAARPHLGDAADDAIERADAFLASQQITEATGREAEHFRLDPRGGWCFAGVWHGWPVSDCTAEAVCARLSLTAPRMSRDELLAAVRFILRTQCSDGGFGSYEARRVELPLEWMNPAEMFGDSMTEKSYVECTASCVAALAEVRHKHPAILPDEIDRAIARAAQSLRSLQRPDGSWAGVWGILHIYGTMFGIRGLLAAGAPPHDPAIRRACAFLRARQKPDGGWGEHFTSIHARRYVEHRESQYVQTAWAMTALLEAEDPDFAALERAASFLAGAQSPDGTYPRQDPEGLFFHSALLDYVLYRRYFPMWALGLYETRRKERARATDARPGAPLHA